MWRKALLPLVLTLACSSSSPSSDDAGADAADATADAGDCVFASGAFPLDAAGPDTQIHAIGAWDGDRVFVALNEPKSGSANFDVFLTALRCDGTPVFAPVRVSEDADNDVDPTITVLADRVLVAWSATTSTGNPNLFLRVRAYDKSGKPLADAQTFSGPRNGAPNVQNTWEPSLAPLGAGAALVGAWGVVEAPAFQAFGARLDAQGVAMGDALDLGIDVTSTQTQPDVASNGSEAWAAWLSQPNQGNGQSVATAHFAGSGAATLGPVLADAASPSISVMGARVWVAASRGTDTVVLLRADAAGVPVELAAKGVLPAVAAAESSGGAFAAYRNGAGGRTIVVSRFDDQGQVQKEIDLAAAGAAPYPLRLVRVTDDVYFVAYQSGTSPAFRARGRFADFR